MLLPLLNVIPSSAASGYHDFLSNPEGYTLRCGDSHSPITAVFQDGEDLVIRYRYTGIAGTPDGELRGTYDLDLNRFDGIYRSLDGQWSGEINFSFCNQREALGSWGFGEGTVVLAR